MDAYLQMQILKADYELVERLLNEPPDRERSRKRLMDAGIIDANGQLTDRHTYLASESYRYSGLDDDSDDTM
ncbi:hypothetical protein ACWKWU_11750 [Chitinophaga lutea]